MYFTPRESYADKNKALLKSGPSSVNDLHSIHQIKHKSVPTFEGDDGKKEIFTLKQERNPENGKRESFMSSFDLEEINEKSTTHYGNAANLVKQTI